MYWSWIVEARGEPALCSEDSRLVVSEAAGINRVDDYVVTSGHLDNQGCELHCLPRRRTDPGEIKISNPFPGKAPILLITSRMEPRSVR